jgi:hypothetical protein
MFRVYYVYWPIILPTDVYGDPELGSDPPSYVPCVRYFIFSFFYAAGARADPRRGRESFVFFLA